MTKSELLDVLKSEGVRFRRVNGFAFVPYTHGVLLKGRIPLGLARKIREGIDTEKCKFLFITVLFGMSLRSGQQMYLKSTLPSPILVSIPKS